MALSHNQLAKRCATAVLCVAVLLQACFGCLAVAIDAPLPTAALALMLLAAVWLVLPESEVSESVCVVCGVLWLHTAIDISFLYLQDKREARYKQLVEQAVSEALQQFEVARAENRWVSPGWQQSLAIQPVLCVWMGNRLTCCSNSFLWCCCTHTTYRQKELKLILGELASLKQQAQSTASNNHLLVLSALNTRLGTLQEQSTAFFAAQTQRTDELKSKTQEMLAAAKSIASNNHLLDLCSLNTRLGTFQEQTTAFFADQAQRADQLKRQTQEMLAAAQNLVAAATSCAGSTAPSQAAKDRTQANPAAVELRSLKTRPRALRNRLLQDTRANSSQPFQGPVAAQDPLGNRSGR